MSMLEVRICRGEAVWDALSTDWQRLWSAQPRREVFTSPAWCRAAWQADGSSVDVALVCVRRAGKLVGLLPLRTDPVRFLSGVNADYNDILVDDPEPVAIVNAALQAVLHEFGQAAFDNLPEWSTLCRTLPQLPEGLRRQIVVEPGQPCPALRLGSEREALLASMTGKQSLKRHEKKLARHGALRLRHIEDRDAIADRLDDFFSQHVARRALAGGRSLFLEERSRRFYQYLLEQFDPANELRFAALEVDGRPVAYHLGFEVDGRFTWYKPSFDVDYWDCGVGEVLLKRLLEYVRERPVHEFDFTRGDEAFKERFSNHKGTNVRWTLRKGGLAARGLALKAQWRQALKSQPVVMDLRQRWRRFDDGTYPLPGHRPGQRAQRHLAPWHWRIFGSSARMIHLSVARSALLERAPVPCAMQVEQTTLKTLALMAVQPYSLCDLDDLRRAREGLRDGDRLFVAREVGRAEAVAWIGARAAAGQPAGDDGAAGVRRAVIEFVGNAWPAADPARLHALLAPMAATASEDLIEVACPVGAKPYLLALRALGFRETGLDTPRPASVVSAS